MKWLSPDTHCAKRCRQLEAQPSRRVMISFGSGHRELVFLIVRSARCSTPTMAANRSNSSSRALMFFLVLIALPCSARSTTLEESAKELARKIAAALQAQQRATCEIRNISSLPVEDARNVEQTLNAELQLRDVKNLAATGCDRDYVSKWARELEVESLWQETTNE